MSKVKIVVAIFLAVFAFSAIAAESASADWFVSGTKTATNSTVALAKTAEQNALFMIEIPFTNKIVTCEGGLGTLLRLTAAVLATYANPPVGGLTLAALIIEHCTVAGEMKTCELEGQPTSLTFNPLAALVTKGPGSKEDRITFAAQTKRTLATIQFSNANTCAFVGEEPLNGSFTAKLPTGQTEQVLQSLVGLGSVENNSLELGAGNKAFIGGGNELLKLLFGSKWSFH